MDYDDDDDLLKIDEENGIISWEYNGIEYTYILDLSESIYADVIDGHIKIDIYDSKKHIV